MKKKKKTKCVSHTIFYILFILLIHSYLNMCLYNTVVLNMFKKKQEQKSKRYPDGPVELFAADLSSGLKRLPLMLVLEIPE